MSCDNCIGLDYHDMAHKIGYCLCKNRVGWFGIIGLNWKVTVILKSARASWARS